MPISDNSCVVFKGRMMTLSVLEIRDTDIAVIGNAVNQQIKRSRDFFARMPVLLSLDDSKIDLPALCEVLAAADLVVVGVLDANEQTAQIAQAAGLGLMTSPAARNDRQNGHDSAAGQRRGDSNSADGRSSHNGTGKATPTNESVRKTATRVVTRPVRSGQQIYARDGDLVVTSSVSQGAEVLADGHIHIYGALRGRALAGASGDTRGRIFCRRFEPDLIAIAGCYKVADAINEELRGACVQVRLDNDNLVIDLQE